MGWYERMAALRSARATLHLSGCGSVDELRLESPVAPWYAPAFWGESLPARARGSFVWDLEGRRWLDLSAEGGALIHGHSARPIRRALRRALKASPAGASVVPSLLGIVLQERLEAMVAPHFKHAIICPSGEAAMACAVRLAGRWRQRVSPGQSCGEPLVVPPFSDEERLLDSSPAAIVVRPVPVGTSLSAEKLAKLFARCQGAGIPLIADEQSSAPGRCGALLAHQGRLQADFAVLGASLAGGALPIGACLCTDQAWEQALRDSDDVVATFQEGAGPLACAAALTSLDMLARRRLGERARAVGETWRAALTGRLASLPCVLEVGGEGLLTWVRLSLPALMPAISLARNHRVLCGLDRSVPEALVFTPPLDVDEALLGTATEALAQALQPYAATAEPTRAAAG